MWIKRKVSGLIYDEWARPHGHSFENVSFSEAGGKKGRPGVITPNQMHLLQGKAESHLLQSHSTRMTPQPVPLKVKIISI